MGRALILGLLATASFAGVAAAQTPPANAPRPPPGCTDAQHHQLDFWIGDWSVFRTDGNVWNAYSRISPVMAGCAVQENYDAAKSPNGPYAGASYSAYDRKDGKWRQTYVDTQGNYTQYAGGLVGADMVFEAQGAGGQGLQRMTYRRQDDGSVRQIGVISGDGGKTWTPGYDLTYRKR